MHKQLSYCLLFLIVSASLINTGQGQGLYKIIPLPKPISGVNEVFSGMTLWENRVYINNIGFESVTYLPKENKVLVYYEFNASPNGGIGYLIDTGFKQTPQQIKCLTSISGSLTLLLQRMT